MIDSHKRSVVKSISWRIVASLGTMLVVFILTRKILLTLGVGVIDALVKMVFYYLHERIWERIKWGKVKHPLGDLMVKRPLSPEDMEKVKLHLQDLGYL